MDEAAVTTTTVLVAVGAALLVLVLVAIVLLVRVRRSARANEARLLELTAEMNARMKEMIEELTESLEHAKEEGRRSRHLASIAGSIDLDEVLARTLEASGAVPGVDAALISVAAEGEKPVVVTLGLSDDEAHRQVISGPPGGQEARAISLAYRYPPELEGAAEAKLKHDSSTNALIRRYRKLKSAG